MMKCALAALAALTLAGCGGPAASPGNMAGTRKAPEPAASPQLAPGQWETVAEIEAMEFPGASDDPISNQIADQMKGKPITVLSCVTPEQARKPGPSLFTGKDNGSCAYRRYAITAGKLAAEASCAGKDGEKSHMTLAGSFAADAAEVELDVTSEGATGTMHQKIKSRSRRLGDCPPA